MENIQELNLDELTVIEGGSVFSDIGYAVGYAVGAAESFFEGVSDTFQDGFDSVR